MTRQFGNAVITRAEAIAAGMTDAQIATRVLTGSWVRFARGVYAIGTAANNPWQRGAGAVKAFRPGLVVASHQTAARMHGLDIEHGCGRPEHVTVRDGRYRPNRAEIMIHTMRLPADDVITVRGVPLTTVRRTLRDLLLGTDRDAAVWSCELAVRKHLVSLGEIAEHLESAARQAGVCRARGWLALADSLSESALETGVRLRALDGGLPPLDLQIPVLGDAGQVIARLDLGYRSLKLGIECDGKASHDRLDAVYYDRSRANLLQNRGWRILRFTWYDLTQRPVYITTTIRAALRALSPAA